MLNYPNTTAVIKLFLSEYYHVLKYDAMNFIEIDPLNTKSRLLYLKTQFVPRSKHFSSRL